MSDKELDKGQRLERIHGVWTDWQNVLDEVGPDRMLEPGVEGTWSAKDVLAHVTYWEEVAARFLEGALKNERPAKSPYSGLDTDDYNAAVQRDTKDRSLDDIRRWSEETHRRVLSAIDKFADEDLANPQLCSWLDGSTLWEVVEGDGYDHMREHTNDVRAWLRGKTAEQEAAV